MAEVVIAGGIELRYDCNRAALPDALARVFVVLAHDEAAQAFVADALRTPHGTLATVAYGMLRRVLSDYDAYGLLGMYPMHLLSSAQVDALLGEHARGRLLDVGAGDGGVTAQLAPAFDGVSVTEQSAQLRRRLRARGYRVLEHDLSQAPLPAGERFDVIACLNVLDRCARPRSLLHHLRAALADDGRLLLSVPLPLRPHVHVGPRTVDPDEPLPEPDDRWEAGAATLAERVLQPAGLRVQALARAPYLCRGDARTPLHVLDAAVFVLA